jgi:phage shock protein PspC (stress-responsive transcriptional regulator)
MGRVEDFEQADAEEGTIPGASQAAASDTYTKAESKRFKGRLYRDSSDKMLGGVCAGIANYINIDPAIVRLLFAIITFGGFGFGIFLYILAWIILPARDLDGYVGKRLFRNPDDRIIGGVAGGLGAYFNKEAWVIRLIFAAPILLNILLSILNGIFHAFNHVDGPDIFFGSISGTFILAYIILWVVLPEAKSPFEKMEMRGEKVDINRIKQNVQEGMGDIKNRMQSWGTEVKESAQNLGGRASEFAGTRGRTFASEVAQTARPVASGIGHVIGILFKAFFLFVAGVIAFALFVMVLVIITGGMAAPAKAFLLDGFWQQAFAWGALLLFLAVPLIAILTWIVRRAMKVRSQNRYLGWVFGSLWLIGWVCLGFFISSMANDFKSDNQVEQAVAITQPRNKMVLQVSDPVLRYSGNYSWLDSDKDGWDLTEDSLKLSNVQLQFDKSPDSNYKVTVYRYSRGRNRNDAFQRAEKLQYSVTSMDSVLELGNGFGIAKGQKFRGQKVIVEVLVPVGKMIRFDGSIADKLNPFDVRVSERRRFGRRNWKMDWDNSRYFDWKTDVDYVMSANGELVDVTNPQPSTNSTDDYEYKSDSAIKEMHEKPANRANEQLEKRRRELEIQKQKIEDAERELRELEEQRRDNQPTTKVAVKKAQAETLPMLNMQSPVFSLII